MVPFWTALNFPKRFVSGCREKAERGQELVFVGWMEHLFFFLFLKKIQKHLMKNTIYTRKKGTLLMGGACVCVWGGGGGKGKGLSFFLSFDPHSCAYG